MQLRQLASPLFFGCAMALAAGAAVTAATESAASTQIELDQLKAAFVLNFARYSVWPESSFAGARSPIVIGVIGDDDVARNLELVAAGELVGGRAIEVERLDAERFLDRLARLEDDPEAAGETPGPHLIFIGEVVDADLDRLLDRLGRHDVLTVGDVDGFAERGGMIGLVLRNRRLAFDANLERIATSRVSISSQVLRLARIVPSRTS